MYLRGHKKILIISFFLQTSQKIGRENFYLFTKRRKLVNKRFTGLLLIQVGEWGGGKTTT